MFSSATKSAAQGGGYNLTKSLRFRSGASTYLNRTPGSAGNQQKWTISFWAKRSNISGSLQKIFEAGTNSSNYLNITWNGSSGGPGADQLDMYCNIGGTQACYFDTSSVYRDCASWYHIVIAADTTQATASNRMKFYVNGTQLTAFTTANYPAQNTNLFVNGANGQIIGNGLTSGLLLDGYLSDFYIIDGQQLTPSAFGSTNATTGVWQPAAYTGGSYGTNGSHLTFANAASTTTLGYDTSGNGNNWTTNNFSLTTGYTYDSVTDVPTLTSATTANYCVWNPINKSVDTVIADGNLTATASVNNDYSVLGSTGITTGKWYWEVKLLVSNAVTAGGISQALTPSQLSGWIGNLSTVYLYNWDGNKYNSGSSAYGATYAQGDIIGTAFDATNGTITFYKNGVSQGTAFTGIPSATYFPVSVVFGGRQVAANFGQQPFAYTPPTGYNALNSYNLPDSTIVKGNKYMDATLYTGNGSTQSITNAASFKPDFVWMKSRSNAYSHALVDSNRGSTKILYSDLTLSEQTSTSTQDLTAFNSNGFSVGTPTNANSTNASGSSIVGWQWQAGQGTNTSNTSGSVTTTVSVNATAGFSIATFTTPGSSGYFTVGHGLGVTPAMVIMKPRNASGDSWVVYHQNMGSPPQNYFMLLNSSAAAANSTTIFGAAPTSTTFQFNAGAAMSLSSTCVMYSWSTVQGFSAFGSYTGNGSVDGPFVYTGFRPKFVMWKKSNAAEAWVILDTSRDPSNLAYEKLYPMSSGASDNGTGYGVLDIVSNGFKIRSNHTVQNASGDTYIYAAFAENPFKNALAR